jgi:hypothetical protein
MPYTNLEKQKEAQQTHYTKNKILYRQRNQAAKQRNREYVITYLLDNPCVDCGEKDIIVLEFDHLSDKDCSVADAIRRSFSIERLQREIDKCEVVCCNCHRRRTSKRGS